MFFFFLRSQEARSKLLGPHWGCWSSWRCAKAGGCGHKAAFPPPETTRAKLCARHAQLRAAPQRWAGGIGTSSASNTLSWNLTKTNSQKRYVLLFIHQGSHSLGSSIGRGLWDYFPSGFRPTVKQSCSPSNVVGSTIKALLKCPEKNWITISCSEGQKGTGRN